MPVFLLLLIYTILPSIIFFSSILHNPSLSLNLQYPPFSSPSFTTLPFALIYTILLALHPTLPFLFCTLHYPSFSSPTYTKLPSHLHPTLHFLLSTLHYPSFSSPSYTTLPSLCTTLPFLLSTLNYDSFSSQS